MTPTPKSWASGCQIVMLDYTKYSVKKICTTMTKTNRHVFQEGMFIFTNNVIVTFKKYGYT